MLLHGLTNPLPQEDLILRGEHVSEKNLWCDTFYGNYEYMPINIKHGKYSAYQNFSVLWKKFKKWKKRARKKVRTTKRLVKVSRELHRLLNPSASRNLCPPSPSLTNRSRRSWGTNLSRVGFRNIENLMTTVFAHVFDLVRVALRCPRFDGEATGALLGTRATHWSLTVVRPKKKCRRDLRWFGCGIGPGVEDEKVSMRPEGLVVIYVWRYILLQVDEAVYRVV